MLLLLPALTLNGQSKNRQTSESKARNVGERIGSEIERFVEKITNGLEEDGEFFDDDSLPSKTRRSRRSTDLESDVNTSSYTGDKVIEESEVFNGNVVVKGGDLTVYGKVDGDVMVIGGTLYVKDGGRITGNARVINGTIVKDDGGVIEGYEDKTRTSQTGYRQDRGRFTRSNTSFNVPWLNESSNLDNFLFRYNRVEGLFMGLGTEKKFYWDGRKSYNTYGSVGYGFKSHTWRYNLGLSRQFPLRTSEGQEMLEIGVEGYSLTDTKDQWLIGLHENTAAALLIHEDFRDYFERRGYTAHVGYYTQQDVTNAELRVDYLVDTYDSLSNKVEWSLFGGDKVFRSNPVIDPGNMRSFMVTAGFSTYSKSTRGPVGWTIYGNAEFAQHQFGSLFEFNRYILDIRRYQPLGRSDNLNLRVRVGTADGNLPMQKSFDLGGIGTLNALPFKDEREKNRMILGNAEYIVNGNFFDDLDFWPSWLFGAFNFLLMGDAGLVRTVEPRVSAAEGFKNITWGEFRHDIGVGVANRAGSYRIAVTWRTDVKEPARILFRFERPF